MNLAVKFWKDVPNPKKLPGEWPAKCVEIGDNDIYEDDWVIMTLEEYNQHRETHRPKYDYWHKHRNSFWNRFKRFFGF